MPGRPPSMYGEDFKQKRALADQAERWFFIGAIFGGSLATLFSLISRYQP